jgi:hypothetical protein
MARDRVEHIFDTPKADAAAELQRFGSDPERFKQAVLESAPSHGYWLAELFTELIAERLRGESEQMRTRLMVEQPELFSKLDRLRAEAEFRFAIAPAIVALGFVLLAEGSWTGSVLPVVAIALTFQGAKHAQAAEAGLVEAVRIGKLSSPSLDQVKTLGTDSWVSDYWRVERAGAATLGQSALPRD